MAKRKIQKRDKKLPGISFMINFPIRFTISSTKDFQNDIKELAKTKGLTLSKFLRNAHFQVFQVKNIEELLDDPKMEFNVNQLKKCFKETYLEEMNSDLNKNFYKNYSEAITSYLQNKIDKKKKKKK